MKKALSFLALAGSFSTLICCFLPAVFVTLGFGASFAALVGNFPQLIWVSEHKTAIFITASVLILLSAFLHWRGRKLACPIDPELAKACQSGKGWSKTVLVLSAGVFLCGALFAFVIPWLNKG